MLAWFPSRCGSFCRRARRSLASNRQARPVRAIGRSSSGPPDREQAGGETGSRHPRSFPARRSRIAGPRPPVPLAGRRGGARPMTSFRRQRSPSLAAARFLAPARASCLAGQSRAAGCWGVSSVLIFSLSGGISSWSSSCSRFGSAKASAGAVAGRALTDSRNALWVSIRNSRNATRFVSWRRFSRSCASHWSV